MRYSYLYAEDILKSEKRERYTASGDSVTADAVLRNPEAIGEAVKNVPEEIGRITKRRV